MIKLKTEVLLFNMFCREDFAKEGIVYSDLINLERRIDNKLKREKIKESVYTDISRNEVGHVIELYPKYFSWDYRCDYDKVIRAQNSDEYYSDKKHKLEFYSDVVPENISDIVLGVIKKMPKKV
ncbi:MAG: hypothetical protein WC781_00445 [Candidatus Pacearchaeota archaeon]|jgi:hypothetical protein